MMAFYQGGRISTDGDAFDYVRIERSLGQEVHATHTSHGFIENLDECFADNFPFSFRVGYALELPEKEVGCVDDLEAGLEVVVKQLNDLRPLV